MRDTSLEAYEYISSTGILGAARTKAYGLLFHHGPMAQFEFERYERPKHYGGTLSKRVNELEQLGLAHDVGRKTNPVSGRGCIVWDVTSNMPNGKYQPRAGPSKKVRAENEACARIAAVWSGMAAQLIRKRMKGKP